MKVEILFFYNNKFLIFLFIIFLTLTPLAQKYSRGLILESEKNNFVVKSPVLRSLDYINLPEHYSLKSFSPEPGNQGQYSTCGAWATAYSARSLSFILSQSISPTLKDNFYFSPSFVYNQLKIDSICNHGITLYEALDILKLKGSIWFKDFDYSCSRQITEEDLSKAKEFKILEYREIFYKNDKLKVLKTKKCISENRPVIIAMSCPISFENAKEIWLPQPEEYNLTHSGHAVVVIGYDNNKYGGAFEILNSWGKEWGDNGYCWIKYSDFDHFVYYGYELIENNNLKYELPISGSVFLKLYNNDAIEFENNDGIIISKAIFKPKTQFEIFITNNTPIYFYCFAIDNVGNFTPIFPKDSLVNNILPYNKSTLPIPDEYHFLETDENGKEDFIILIYSKKPLDLRAFIPEKIKSKSSVRYLVSKLQEESNKNLKLSISLDNNIYFNAVSHNTDYVPLIIKIKKEK